MTYLVDANVISEPTKPAPSSKVVDWLSTNEGNLVVDSIILGEPRPSTLFPRHYLEHHLQPETEGG
jgi:predicted nucleic acid-binding protein